MMKHFPYPPWWAMTPPPYAAYEAPPTSRRSRSPRTSDLDDEIERIKRWQSFLEEQKKAKDGEKKPDDKTRKWTILEVATILTLLSPLIAAAQIKFWMWSAASLQAALTIPVK